MKKFIYISAVIFICLCSNIASAADCEVPNRNARPINRFDVVKAYPSEAARRNIQGSVSVEVKVDMAGLVTDAKIVKFSDPVFNSKSLIEAAKTMKFSPAIKDCEVTDGSYMFNVVFKIR